MKRIKLNWVEELFDENPSLAREASNIFTGDFLLGLRRGKDNPLPAWHVVGSMEGTPVLRNGEPIHPGFTYKAAGPIEMCYNGLHGSLNLRDAILYGTINALVKELFICRVGLSGGLYIGRDKIVAQRRKVYWALNIGAMVKWYGEVFVDGVLEDGNIADLMRLRTRMALEDEDPLRLPEPGLVGKEKILPVESPLYKITLQGVGPHE